MSSLPQSVTHPSHCERADHTDGQVYWTTTRTVLALDTPLLRQFTV
jgi:hypothetical protein